MRSADEANRARALAAAAEAVRQSAETVSAMARLFRAARIGKAAPAKRKRGKRRIGF